MSILMAVLGVSSGLFGAFIGPGLSDRLGRKPVVILFSLVGGIAPLALLNFNGSFVLLNILCFLGWSASGAFVLVMATIPAESIPPRYIASVVGLTQGVGEIAGGMLAPLLAGRMADRFNLAAPLVLMAACAITASVLACLLKETAPGKPSASGEIGEMGSVTYEKH
jgi:MFS family permease